MMEDINNPEDNINNDDGTIDESSDIEDEDSENEDTPPVWLNNNTLQRLKQNDSGITNLSISLGDGYFNTIDWKEEGGCISNNTQLKKLRISYDSSLTKPSYWLGEEGDNLPTREQLQDFFSCIYRNNSIEALSFCSIHINDKFGEDLINGLCGHPNSLTRFNWQGNPNALYALAKVLKHPKSKLKELTLPNCHLDDECMRILCDGLVGNGTIKRLNLHGNKVTLAGWRALTTVLRHPNCKLTNLSLSSTSLNDEDVNILGGALIGSSVKVLNLSLNLSMRSVGWQTLMNRLSQSSLEKLDFGYNMINDDCLGALVSISTLKSLDLGSNCSVTPSGWRSFFNSLSRTTTRLVKLKISGDNIGNEGVVALGRLLSNMSSLKTLEMGNLVYSSRRSTDITSQHWISFFTTLQDSNLDLMELDIHYNQIDDEGLQLLIRLASSMNSLKILSLSQLQFVTPTGWQALSEYLLSPNFALRKLDLDGNNINDDMVVALTSALAHNTTLERLCLDGTWDASNHVITERGREAVSHLLCNKTSIMSTYSSNHTLNKLGDDDDYNEMRMNLPGNLLSYLEMNENKDKVEVARQKILQTHFSNEDNDTSNIQEFLDMDLEVMPAVIAWIGRSKIGWVGRDMSGLSLMFHLLRRLPDLFDSSAQKMPSSAVKRKRDNS